MEENFIAEKIDCCLCGRNFIYNAGRSLYKWYCGNNCKAAYFRAIENELADSFMASDVIKRKMVYWLSNGFTSGKDGLPGLVEDIWLYRTHAALERRYGDVEALLFKQVKQGQKI